MKNQVQSDEQTYWIFLTELYLPDRMLKNSPNLWRSYRMEIHEVFQTNLVYQGENFLR